MESPKNTKINSFVPPKINIKLPQYRKLPPNFEIPEKNIPIDLEYTIKQIDSFRSSQVSNSQLSQDSNQQLSNDFNQQLSQDSDQQLSQDSNKQLSQNMNKKLSQDSNQQLSQNMNQQLSQNINQQLSQNMNQQLSQNMNQQLSQNMNQQLSQNINQQLSQNPEQKMPNNKNQQSSQYRTKFVFNKIPTVPKSNINQNINQKLIPGYKISPPYVKTYNNLNPILPKVNNGKQKYVFSANNIPIPGLRIIPNKYSIMMLPDDTHQTLDLKYFKEQIVRIGTIGEGSCFFHAYIKGYYPPYQESNNTSAKIKFIADLRKGLGIALDFQTEDGQTFYEKYNFQGLASFDPFFKIQNLKRFISNPSECVGDEIYQYVADILGMGFIMTELNSKEWRIIKKYKSSFSRQGFAKYVVIVNIPGHYELIGLKREYNGRQLFQTIFDEDDNFIRDIEKYQDLSKRKDKIKYDIDMIINKICKNTNPNILENIQQHYNEKDIKKIIINNNCNNLFQFIEDDSNFDRYQNLDEIQNTCLEIQNLKHFVDFNDTNDPYILKINTLIDKFKHLLECSENLNYSLTTLIKNKTGYYYAADLIINIGMNNFKQYLQNLGINISGINLNYLQQIQDKLILLSTFNQN